MLYNLLSINLTLLPDFSALLYTALLMPVRIAFVADDVLFWVIADWMIDSLFFIDVFINFFSAYFDNDDNLVVDRKVSAFKGEFME